MHHAHPLVHACLCLRPDAHTMCRGASGLPSPVQTSSTRPRTDSELDHVRSGFPRDSDSESEVSELDEPPEPQASLSEKAHKGCKLAGTPFKASYNLRARLSQRDTPL